MMMPFHTIIPPYGPSPKYSGHAWVPIDDHNTMAWTITYHPTRDLSDNEIERMRSGWGLHLGLDKLAPETGEAGSRWRPIANRDNNYMVDYDLQRTKFFTGLPGTAMQDQAMQETMGPIYDRSNEHLGTSDTGIIQVRRRWLKAATDLRDHGITPLGADDPDAYFIRSAGVVLPRDAAWVEASQDFLNARQGVSVDNA
jgi:hypothetical protein